MPKVRWIGIIDDASAYQQGDLPENAVKIRSPQSIDEMMIKAMPFLIPSFVILVGSMFLKVFLCRFFSVKPLFILIGFLCGFILLPVHELLHAVVYPGGAEVSIGLMPKKATAVALCSYPMARKRFVIMCLLPFVLGIVPIALFWLLPGHMSALNSFLFGLAAMGLCSPYPDCYNVYLVMKQAPKNAAVQFYKDDLYYTVS